MGDAKDYPQQRLGRRTEWNCTAVCCLHLGPFAMIADIDPVASIKQLDKCMRLNI